MTETYRRWYPSQNLALVIRADFGDASCPIEAQWVERGEQPEDAEWHGTPYRVADARHWPTRAIALVYDRERQP